MANSVHQWLMGALLAMLHPYFISVVDINHNTKEKNIEVSVRIFTDDFEKALASQYKTKVDILKKEKKAENDKLVSNYIQSQLQIKQNGKPVTLKYLGYEQQQESIWVYLESPATEATKKMDVHCTLLYQFTNKQINIVHAKANGAEKSYKLDYPAGDVSFSW